jgi:PAS domain S-box-containing protein
MKFNQHSHSVEIRFILMVFILIAVLMIGSKINSLYQIHAMKKMTNHIFDYPFKVSNTALSVRSEVYKIHRDMKDVVLSESNAELQKAINEVNEHEQHVYEYLTVIRQSSNNEAEKKLEQQTRELFREWKPIRDEVIDLVKKNQRDEAIAITKGKGAKQVLKLEASTFKLSLSAQNEANRYKYYSDTMHEKFQKISIMSGIVILILVFLIAYYTVTRISNYIFKTNHLTDVLSVIRAVNQLIVREKNKEKLAQEICNILVSNRVYSNAWIALYDDSKRIKYVTSGDNSENFIQLKTKLESGWLPPCIQNINGQNEGHLLIENTKESCPECPFTDLYENKGAFSIQLKYNEKVYGNLTLSVNAAFLKDKEEISLLHEVAGDISYALYNLETESHLKEHENSLFAIKELYENIIDSVDNIIFVKDIDFIYVVCNQAFEKLVGKSNKEIIGKSDYEIFDKEVADFFREHDTKMLSENKSKSNFEWVTYPDGREVYLLTVKSPLHDSSGKPIGLVGNSVDVTETKRVQEALIESEEQFKLTIQQSPSIIELYDLSGTQIEVNLAYEELWGFPAKHSLHTFNLFKSDEVKKTGLIHYIERAYAGEIVTVPPYEYDSTGRTEADGLGRKRWLKTRIYPLKDTAGKVKNIVITHEDITEEIKSKNELRKSRENYQLLADNALDLIWKMNMNLEFTYVNPSVETLLGYPVYEFVGTKLHQHCSEKQFEIIQALVTEMLGLNTKDGVSLEAVLYKKDGSELPLEINGKIIFDDTHTPIGFQGSARDFTLQTQAREKLNDALNELEKKSHELQTILKEAPNPIMLHNEAGEVLMINKVWERLSGYSFDEINTIEKWTKKACHKKSLLKQKEIDELYSIDEKINLGENIVTSKDGHEMIWQVSSAPLGTINGKRTVVTSAMDITELKKKDELMMAQSRHAAMGEMIGMIAHQWRQPIAGIAMDANNMLLDIAFETFDNTSAAQYAQDILDQTNHLSKTIDDFRNFFKPDKSVSAVNVEDIIEETLAIVKESLTNNSIALETSYLSNSLVNAYPRELMQVFVNIINNAKDSLLSNHTQNALIEIKTYDDERYVNAEICDNGGGIDTAILPKVFDPYFSTKDEKTGTGLGLYMSKMIIEEHLHGCIEASNNKDGGACFKIRLLKKNSTSDH